MNVQRIKIFILFMALCAISLHAQVTIGESKDPEEFISLKLVSTRGGLRYPQLSTAERAALGALNANSLAYGLMIYNTTGTGCLEYVKGADGWFNLCSVSLRSMKEVADVRISGDETIDFTSFVQAGTEAENSSDLVREYTVDITNVDGLRNLRVGKYLDFKNVIRNVELISPDKISPSNKIKVSFYPKVVDMLKEREINNPIRATIYATYNEDGRDRQVKLEVNVIAQDAAIL